MHCGGLIPDLHFVYHQNFFCVSPVYHQNVPEKGRRTGFVGWDTNVHNPDVNLCAFSAMPAFPAFFPEGLGQGLRSILPMELVSSPTAPSLWAPKA